MSADAPALDAFARQAWEQPRPFDLSPSPQELAREQQWLSQRLDRVVAWIKTREPDFNDGTNENGS